jgi:mRNA interferase RelE/StbE
MNTVFRRSFTRDLRKIKDQRVLNNVQTAIENVEAADAQTDIANLKKLANSDSFYRIRIGDYRIGIAIEGGGNRVCTLSAPPRLVPVLSLVQPETSPAVSVNSSVPECRVTTSPKSVWALAS